MTYWRIASSLFTAIFAGFILFGSWSFYFRKPQVVTQTVYASNSTVGATLPSDRSESRRVSPFVGVYGGNKDTFGLIAGVSF